MHTLLLEPRPKRGAPKSGFLGRRRPGVADLPQQQLCSFSLNKAKKSREIGIGDLSREVAVDNLPTFLGIEPVAAHLSPRAEHRAGYFLFQNTSDKIFVAIEKFFGD